MLKPKVGDLVRLKPFKIIDGTTEGRFALTHDDGYWFSVAENEIEEILPRPLAVGDRVRFVLGAPDCPSDARGTIVAISGEWAWVRHDGEFGGGWSTFNTRYLARAEPA